MARRAAAALTGLPKDRIPAAVDLLLRGHPSIAPLWRLATEVLAATDPARAAQAFLAELDSDREAAAAAAAILPDRVLTLSYSSTVVEAIRLRRPAQTVCMRSDPGGEGTRVAEETRDSTWAIVVDDDEALERVPGEAVLVGADALTPEGIVNKVKTRLLAEAARAKGIPRYAVAGTAKLLGAAVPLRAPFELVALELFTAIALPGELVPPREAGKRAATFRLVPRLQALLQDLSTSPT
jgi:Initiation factor 2 subunit family